METVPLLFGFACAGALALARHSEDEQAGPVAMILLASWAVSNVAWLFDSIEKLAVMDGMIAAYAMLLYFEQPARWRWRFLWLAVAQLALDVAYGLTGPDRYPAYSLLYNLSFAGELIVIGGTGGIHVGRYWRDGLRRLRAVLARQSASG